LFDFNLSNCPHRYTASPAQEEETELLTSIRLVAAGFETLIYSQPAPAEECCQVLAELRQVLVRLVNS